MKAFVVDKYQKKGALRLAELPEPAMGADDVIVEIHAAGVNLLDSKIRDGEFKIFLPYRTPSILGHDIAGKVVSTGEKVRRFKVGDEVYARVRDHRIGTFAERIAITEADLALKPKNLSMVEAASIPLVGLTAWQALVEVGKVKPGQKVFIQAGSGGVGTFAIQLAKRLGATVATTTSSSNAELVKGLGADLIIDYKSQDFEKSCRIMISAQAPRPKHWTMQLRGGLDYRRRPPRRPLEPSAANSRTLRSGSFTAFASSGNASTLLGMAIAWTNNCWKCGSSAVSIFSTLATVASISRRWVRLRRAMRAPVPAALPTALTRVTGRSRG